MAKLNILALVITTAVAFVAREAHAQEALPWLEGTTQTEVGGLPVTPLRAPVLLRLAEAPSFRIVVEGVDHTGVTSGAPGRYRIEGTGSLRASTEIGGAFALTLRFTDVSVDNAPPAARGTLAEVRAHLSPLGVTIQSDTDTSGLVTGDGAALRGTPTHFFVLALLDVLGPGLALLPQAPVVADAPLLDLSPVIDWQVNRLADASLARRPTPGRVVGYASYGGRLGVAAKADTGFRAVLGPGEGDFALTGEQIVDVVTGLPLYTEMHLRGAISGGPLEGRAEGIMRIALVLPGMPEPNFGRKAPPPPAPSAAAPESAPKVDAPPAALPAPSYGHDPAQRLETLRQLHKQGLITDQEYRAKRAEILDSL